MLQNGLVVLENEAMFAGLPRVPGPGNVADTQVTKRGCFSLLPTQWHADSEESLGPTATLAGMNTFTRSAGLAPNAV